MDLHDIEIRDSRIGSFCTRNHIRKLSFFGSILTPEFGSESDVDVLVEFETGQIPGFLGLARMERELSGSLGRKVDLRTPNELSRYSREEVLSSALTLYASG